jgi:hypothetical protein
MSKLKVGQTIYLTDRFNRSGIDRLLPVQVESVGRKYFTVKELPQTRFFIESITHDARNYSPRYTVYMSEQEYHDRIKLSGISGRVCEFFRHSPTLSLPQWEAVENIINNSK